jgi:hypothetical protein
VCSSVHASCCICTCTCTCTCTSSSSTSSTHPLPLCTYPLPYQGAHQGAHQGAQHQLTHSPRLLPAPTDPPNPTNPTPKPQPPNCSKDVRKRMYDFARMYADVRIFGGLRGVGPAIFLAFACRGGAASTEIASCELLGRGGLPAGGHQPSALGGRTRTSHSVWW